MNYLFIKTIAFLYLLLLQLPLNAYACEDNEYYTEDLEAPLSFMPGQKNA
jgi:hypothetical protein